MTRSNRASRDFHHSARFTSRDLILPMAAACSTAILFIADIIGRVVADREIPAGVMLVFVGVPFFLIVVRRTRFRAVA